jgi:hypothetical protein
MTGKLSRLYYFFFKYTKRNCHKSCSHRLELPERISKITQYTFTWALYDRFGSETYACTISISRKKKDLWSNDRRRNKR